MKKLLMAITVIALALGFSSPAFAADNQATDFKSTYQADHDNMKDGSGKDEDGIHERHALHAYCYTIGGKVVHRHHHPYHEYDRDGDGHLDFQENYDGDDAHNDHRDHHKRHNRHY